MGVPTDPGRDPFPGVRAATANRPRMRTYEECEAFLARVGMATVLPSKDGLLPCLLWEARGRRGPAEEWDEAFDNIWRWKDDLTGARTAFGGRLFGDRVILLHRGLLAPFLRWRGMPGTDVEDLYREGLLTREARRVAAVLEAASGALARATLRHEAGMAGKAGASRFERACRDLERRLFLTRAGRAATSTGWDSNAHALVRDWFPEEVAEARRWPADEAADAVREALRTAAPEATERDLARWMRAL